MSSSKGLYKSRLFTFINRQRIRFNDRLGRTIRNLQLTTEVEIKGWLYPLFQMLNRGFSVKRQLKQKITAFLLLSPTNRTKTQSSSTKIVSRSTTTSNSRLSSRVDQENTLDIGVDKKDILIPVDAKEKEDYRLSQHIAIQNSLTSIPIRFCWTILNWLQISPIISRIKPLGYSKNPSDPVKSITAQASEKPKLLISQDQEVVKLKTTSFFSSLVRRLSSYGEGKLQVRTNNQITKQTQVSPTFSSLTIRDLFQQAIQHFFGKNQRLLYSHELEDVAFDESLLQINPQSSQFTILASTEYEHLSSSVDAIESFQPAPIQTQNAPVVGNFTTYNYSDSKLELDSDLWETKAITIGYVKNISDSLLELLDQVIWWIEELCRKIWQLFHRIFSR